MFVWRHMDKHSVRSWQSTRFSWKSKSMTTDDVFFCYGRLLKSIRIVVFTTQTQTRYRKRYTRCPEHVCSSGVDPDLFLLGRTVSVSWRSIPVSCYASAVINANTGITNDISVSEKDTWISQFLVRRLIFVIFHISKLNNSCSKVYKFSMKL